MSNKKRKALGARKLRRAWLVRVARGARRAGSPLPGMGVRASRASGAYAAETEKLQDEVRELVYPYFGFDRGVS